MSDDEAEELLQDNGRLRAINAELQHNNDRYRLLTDEQHKAQTVLAKTNARVHAINAELLAACERLVTDYCGVPDPTDRGGQAVFTDARAAIARAKGETP